MQRRVVALALGALVLGPLFAGCASSDDAPAQAGQPLNSGSSNGGGVTSDPTPVTPTRPKSSSERWHFHDYWKGNPTITLFDAEVTLNATPGSGREGLPGLSAIIALPNGVIVPAETGFLIVNATWDSPVPGGSLNITYRPSDSQSFFPAGNITNAAGGRINTTESMCDVPHRQESYWRFNLTAAPDDAVPPGVPAAQTIRIVITATIGRQLFIDPPHVNWWQDGDVIPLVESAKGEAATVVTRQANLSLLGGAPTVTATPTTVRVPVDAGRIVPEGAQSVVVVLNWSSEVGDAKLMLRYREANLPSEGPLEVKVDEKGHRIFVLSVKPPMTDTTYSNRTTWDFQVIPEGSEAAAFRGTFELTAWASRHNAADIVTKMGLS